MFHALRPQEAANRLTLSPTSEYLFRDNAGDASVDRFAPALGFAQDAGQDSTQNSAQNLGQARVRLCSVRKSFGNGPVVNNVSLDIPAGSITGLIGRSGAGKSTLLRVAALLEKPDSGEVYYDASLVSGLVKTPLLEARRRAGLVFQAFNLFSSRTAAGNVAFPLEAASRPKHYIKDRVAYLLDLVGLGDKANRPVGRLSGGERQRVAIARALANEPEILFCDEATSALDPETTAQVLDLIVSLRDRFDLTVFMVTHQMEVVRRTCNRVAVIEQGCIVEHGTVRNVFESPESQAARRMVSRRGDWHASPEAQEAAPTARGGGLSGLSGKEFVYE